MLLSCCRESVWCIQCGCVVGYIVASGVRRACGVQGLRIIVQSDRSSDYVEQRVEAFLLTMKVHTLV